MQQARPQALRLLDQGSPPVAIINPPPPSPEQPARQDHLKRPPAKPGRPGAVGFADPDAALIIAFLPRIMSLST
jgi:hypothetical protein